MSAAPLLPPSRRVRTSALHPGASVVGAPGPPAARTAAASLRSSRAAAPASEAVGGGGLERGMGIREAAWWW